METVSAEMYRQVGEAVLESMFFEPLAAEPSVEPEPPPGSIHSRVSFQGTLEGAMELAIAPETLQRLATNFLGLDESVADDQQQRDTLCELTNIFCGCLLSHTDPGGKLTLAAPVIVDQPMPPQARRWLTLPLEEGALAVRLDEEYRTS